MKNRQLVTLVVPLEMYRQVTRLAMRENKPISSVIREAMAAHLERELGVQVSPHMPRGGWRGGGKG
jgi:predicted DNA-binding protein